MGSRQHNDQEFRVAPMNSSLNGSQKNKDGWFSQSVCAGADNQQASFQWSVGLKMLQDR
jgi:hypothetical protein